MAATSLVSVAWVQFPLHGCFPTVQSGVPTHMLTMHCKSNEGGSHAPFFLELGKFFLKIVSKIE